MKLHNLPQDLSYSSVISSLKAVSPNALKFPSIAWSCNPCLLEHWLNWDTSTDCQFARSKSFIFSILSEDYIKFNVNFSGKRGPPLCELKTRATIKTFSSASAEQKLLIHNTVYFADLQLSFLPCSKCCHPWRRACQVEHLPATVYSLTHYHAIKWLTSNLCTHY